MEDEKRVFFGLLSMDTGVTLIGGYMILRTVLSTIETFYYGVALTLGPASFLVVIYAGFCTMQLIHRFGGEERDSHMWRRAIFLYFAIAICFVAKLIWVLFLNGVWSDYGTMVCAKSQSVEISALDESLIFDYEWFSDIVEQSKDC